MGQDRHFITAPPEKRLNMLSDAKKKANAKWDKAHMMILGCKVRKDFADRHIKQIADHAHRVTILLFS